jgi:tRNA(Leu) C34 or U34 (ribose-2'-O)-methylase TrmL
MSCNDTIGVKQLVIPQSYLIIANISKRNNVRSLLQVGVAFGCTKILVVGQRSFQFTICDDEENSVAPTDIPKHLLPIFASGTISIERFDKWQHCIDYIKDHDILLIGVEIHKDAKTIQEICHHLHDTSNDSRDVAFLMGNEGTGLLDKHMQSCDMFCRIPQYGAGTASLNVYIAASIIFYHFHMYQGEQKSKNEHSSIAISPSTATATTTTTDTG